MKKLFGFLALVLVLYIAPSPSFDKALAAEKTQPVYLDELAMSIELPSEYVYATRNVQEDDPALELFETTREQELDFLERDCMYLDARVPDGSAFISVMMTGEAPADFNQLDAESLQEALSTWMSICPAGNATVLCAQVYDQGQAIFLRQLYKRPVLDGTMEVEVWDYYTFYNRKIIDVLAMFVPGETSAEEEKLVEDVINSIRFDIEPAGSQAEEASPAVVYTDTATGLQFTLPEGWTEQPSDGNEWVIFTKNDSEGIIFYLVQNLWKSMPQKERQKTSRDKIDNDYFTKAEVVQLLDIPEVDEDSLSTVTYGGKEYYQFDYTETTSQDGVEFVTQEKYLFRIENGFMYSYIFGGTSRNMLWGDFEALVSSAQYLQPRQYSTADYVVSYVFEALLLVLVIGTAVSLVALVYLKHDSQNQRKE